MGRLLTPGQRAPSEPHLPLDTHGRPGSYPSAPSPPHAHLWGPWELGHSHGRGLCSSGQWGPLVLCSFSTLVVALASFFLFPR